MAPRPSSYGDVSCLLPGSDATGRASAAPSAGPDAGDEPYDDGGDDEAGSWHGCAGARHLPTLPVPPTAHGHDARTTPGIGRNP